MKLTLSRDMAAERTRGRDAIEAIFAPRLAAALSPVSPIHALKAQEADRLLTAAGVSGSSLLAPEAKARGITVAALGVAIRAKRDARNAVVAAVEVDRQRAQLAIDAAKSPAEVDVIIARIA